MSRSVMRYVNRVVANKVVPEILGEPEVEYYIAPHIKGQEDILGMWDMICYGKRRRVLVFVQVCERGGRRRCIERHKLMTAEMYPDTEAVRFYLITYRRKGGRYVFDVEEIVKGEDGVVKMRSLLSKYIPHKGGD